MNEHYLHSKRVITPLGIVSAFVRIRDGRIVSVDQAPTSGISVDDFGDLVLSPGVVDTHAHLNEPGRTEWEGYETATRAAASGGVTTIIDMPLNCIPATTSVQALIEKRQAVKAHASVDYGFWGGVVPGNEGELDGMMDSGVCGFKAFLIDSGVAEFPMVTESDLMKAMPRLARRRVPLLVHAELEGPSEKPVHSEAYVDYLRSRPREWEQNAIRMMISLSERTRCPIHIVHLSDADSVALIDDAKNRGVPITVETCPHYLTFSAETIENGDTIYKCAPPIREESNREKLWSAVLKGQIDCIVSDHSPCTPSLKNRDTGDFSTAWGGIAGLQFLLSTTFTEGVKRGLLLPKLFRFLSHNTARLAGISFKGAILPGNDADLVVWDPDERYTVQESMVHHRHSVTPFLGRELKGRVKKTWVRGELVYDNGQFFEFKGMEIKRGERQ